MCIESLESRRLLSVSSAVLPGGSVHLIQPAAVQAELHALIVKKRLTSNIIGSYTGSYRLGNVTFAGSETLVITSRSTKSFAGTLSFDDGPATPFTAALSAKAQVPSLGYGYKFTFPLKYANTKLHLKGEFQDGANGFIVQMTGKFNGQKVPKPHGELTLSPDDPSTFL